MWRVLNNCSLDCIKTQQLLVLLHVTWGPRNQLGWEVRGSDPPSSGTHLPAEDPAPPWGVLEARPPHRTGPHDPVRGPLVHPPCRPHIRRKQQPGVEDAASERHRQRQRAHLCLLQKRSPTLNFQKRKEATKYRGPIAGQALGSVL